MERPGSNAGSFPFFRLAPFAGLWVLACVALSVHWSVNPQYQYGWFVPALALYTAFNRWQTRPRPGPAARGAIRLAVAMAVTILPTWVLSQPNPDWPLLNWLLTAEIMALTLAAIAAVGGEPWVRHFFFPVVFVAVAIPWPDFIESPLMQGMMRVVAGLSVALLDLAGVSAIQHGNLIEVATGTVGVEETCSGIRSLQGSLMASLFLGELFRFTTGRRVLLVVVSILTAFITNVFRAGFLAWTAAASDVSAVDRWHDPAGMTILMICVGAILLAALFLNRNSRSPVALSAIPSAHPLPAWFVPALTIWVAFTVVGTELWYYDGSAPPESPWKLVPPTESEPFPIPPSALAAFRSDRTTSATWLAEDGRRWLLYFFEWDYGPAFTRVAAQMHRPEICLPASGRQLHEDRGKVSFTVDGVTLPFHAYSFEQQGRLLFVYHGVWQFRSERGLRHGPLSFHKQIAGVQSALWRERRVG